MLERSVEMRLCLVEDRAVGDLEPLTLTRPAFDLLCGLSPLAVKQRAFFSGLPVGVLVRPELADVYRLDHPNTPVNDTDWLAAGPAVLVNGRWLPPPAGKAEGLGEPCVAMIGEEVAYVVAGPEQLAGCTPEDLDHHLERWKRTLPRRRTGGLMFRYLWEMVSHNAEQITLDWECAAEQAAAFLSPVPVLVGPQDRLVIHPTARIEPMVVADTTGGPVVIDRDAAVTAFTRLEGPCYVGPRTEVLGARVRPGTTLGPECRIGGEVEASIVQGYSNKYHDGFLGHAYLGEWVNLGAGTQNSDLRNDYGEVAVTVNGRRVGTGQTKVGCFLGDHTKTGLGALLNTGTSAGIFCNLLPGGLLPKYVPSFATYWNGTLADRADLSDLLGTAARVMARRGKAFTEAHEVLYERVFERTAGERARAVRDAQARLLRRSA
jgi:UDP-N-acetylglucosamine diphosphorylase/glucosamine-1-phosphate N-acetyltransferase